MAKNEMQSHAGKQILSGILSSSGLDFKMKIKAHTKPLYSFFGYDAENSSVVTIILRNTE